MRVVENAQHLCSEIARDQQENPGRVLDDAAMEEYLQDYTLSGILVLSAEGKILCGASQDGRVADPQVREQMEKELAGSIVLKVADHPQQVYAGRTEKEDSSYVDTAACARKDGDGVLVVYYRTTAEYVRNYSLSYQNCVQGYNPAVDGIIVVTRGDRIVASNDTSLLDTTVDENPTLSALKARSTDGGMIHMPAPPEAPSGLPPEYIKSSGRYWLTSSFLSPKPFFKDRINHIHINGLSHIIAHSTLCCPALILLEHICGHGDHRNSFPVVTLSCTDICRSLIPIHHRHLNIHEDQFIIILRPDSKKLDRLLPILCHIHDQTGFGQKLVRNLPVQLIVLHQHDPASLQKARILFLLFTSLCCQ